MAHRFNAISGAIIAVAVTAMCQVAVAGIVPVGDVLTGGSWGQRFEFNSFDASSVDLVAVFLETGGPFEAPTFRGWDSPDWEIGLDAPDLAAAGSSSPVEKLGFGVWFEAEPADPLSFIFGAWRPGEQTPFEAYELSWTGGKLRVWSGAPVPVGDIHRPIDGSHGVPVLPAALLGAVGVGVVSGLNILRRSFRR
jgi:hypothetical protein